MADKRQHQRIGCAEKCLLYYNNSRYSGAVMNISISGAMVTLFGSKPEKIARGDTCSLILSECPASPFYSYKSMITRVTPEGLGLEILEHDFS